MYMDPGANKGRKWTRRVGPYLYANVQCHAVLGFLVVQLLEHVPRENLRHPVAVLREIWVTVTLRFNLGEGLQVSTNL